jgi:hypothetical protein
MDCQVNTNLDLLAHTTYNGPGNGYDTGLGIVKGMGRELYVSASITEILGDFNIRLARHAVLP